MTGYFTIFDHSVDKGLGVIKVRAAGVKGSVRTKANPLGLGIADQRQVLSGKPGLPGGHSASEANAHCRPLVSRTSL